jgi:hypothetical protein
MPRLVRFMIENFSTGAAIGLFCAAALLWSGPAGLTPLVERGADSPVAAALLALSLGSSFGLGYLATALAFLDEAE